MISEDLDRVYLDRTRQLAEKNALPEVFQTLFSGGMQVIDGSFDPSLLGKKVGYLRKRLSTDAWADQGTLTLDLDKAFPGAHGMFTAEYDSEIDENLVQCLKSAYPNVEAEALPAMIRQEFKDYRRIKSVLLKSERHTFDFREHVPADWSLHAYTRGDARLIETAFANPQFHFIVSPQPIDSRLGLHQLLHEVGHVVRYKEQTPEEIARESDMRGKDKMTVSEKKDLVRSERDANAFALSHLWHFFGPEDMDIFRQLSYTALLGYQRK